MKVDNWTVAQNKITRTFMFKDFIEAFSFLTKVAILAEKQNHHPEIFNIYNKVVIHLNTHDAGDIVTEKDYKLASEINKLIS